MARIEGLEKKQAPWHLRWFYSTMRKMFGKELTPVKLQMGLPGLVLGQHRHGGRIGPQAQSIAAPHSVGEGAHRGARGLSVLSGHQFCRRQESRID
jgi:hypothetical protein